MLPYDLGCDVGRTLQFRAETAFRSASREIRRQGHYTDEKEQDQPDFLQGLTASEEATEIDAQRDAKSDGWQMIQKQMSMSEI